MRLSGPDRSGRDDAIGRASGLEHRPAVVAGPYVLGALSVAQRVEFEVHLAGCVECRRAVDDAAALPALLDLVPADVVRSLTAGADLPAEGGGDVGRDRAAADVEPADVEPADDAGVRVRPAGLVAREASRDPGPPPILLADLLRAARREELASRRRRWLGASLAAAAVVVLVLLVTGGRGLPWRPAPVPSIATEAIELAPLLDVPVQASVRLDAVAWGTKIDLRCSYAGSDAAAGGAYGGGSATAYSLVVRDAAGNVEEVATWTAVPGHEVTVPAATGMPRDEIVEVELRSGGTPVLRAPA